MKKGLIPKTTLTDYTTDEFPLILEHEKIPVIVLPCYWSFSMIKDAAILTLQVNKIANKYGYQLIDSHFWNIAFHHGKPIFLDTGSLLPYSKKIADVFLAEFQRGFLAALTMMNVREIYFARKLLLSCADFYIRTLPAQTVENTPSYSNAVSIFKSYHSAHSPNEINTLIHSVFDKHIFEPESIEKLFSYPPTETPWTNYQTTFLSDLLDPDKCKSNGQYIRFNKIIDLFQKYAADAKSSIDLAGNSGGFSYLLSQRVPLDFYVSVDYDENAIETGYHFFKQQSTPITLAFHNFTLSDSPAVKGDCIFALAVIHHLALVQKIRLDIILRILKRYTNKYVFVEFMPLGLWDGVHETPALPDWYTEDWFKGHFCHHFKLLHREQLEENRIIYIGQV